MSTCTCGECDPAADPRFTGRDLSQTPLSQELRDMAVDELDTMGVPSKDIHLEVRRSCYCRSIHWQLFVDGVSQEAKVKIAQHLGRLWKTAPWQQFSNEGFLHLADGAYNPRGLTRLTVTRKPDPVPGAPTG